MTKRSSMKQGIIKTKIGFIEVKEENGRIVSLDFIGEKEPAVRGQDSPLIRKALKQIDEYFKKERTEFDLPVKISGTSFQQRVLKEVMKVGYGKTASYKDIAERIGSGQAMRAVGSANRQNSIPLIIPCHRIIGKDFSVKGYAGKQTVKIFLLTLENPEIKNIIKRSNVEVKKEKK